MNELMRQLYGLNSYPINSYSSIKLSNPPYGDESQDQSKKSINPNKFLEELNKIQGNNKDELKDNLFPYIYIHGFSSAAELQKIVVKLQNVFDLYKYPELGLKLEALSEALKDYHIWKENWDDQLLFWNKVFDKKIESFNDFNDIDKYLNQWSTFINQANALKNQKAAQIDLNVDLTKTEAQLQPIQVEARDFIVKVEEFFGKAKEIPSSKLEFAEMLRAEMYKNEIKYKSTIAKLDLFIQEEREELKKAQEEIQKQEEKARQEREEEEERSRMEAEELNQRKVEETNREREERSRMEAEELNQRKAEETNREREEEESNKKENELKLKKFEIKAKLLDLNTNDQFFNRVETIIQKLEKECERVREIDQSNIRSFAIEQTIYRIRAERVKAIDKILEIEKKKKGSSNKIIEKEKEQQNEISVKTELKQMMTAVINTNLINNNKLDKHRPWGTKLGKFLINVTLIVPLTKYGYKRAFSNDRNFTIWDSFSSLRTKSHQNVKGLFNEAQNLDVGHDQDADSSQVPVIRNKTRTKE